MRILENRLVRRVLSPQGEKITGDWVKPHNKTFHIFNLG
jgi:hypothetical protein